MGQQDLTHLCVLKESILCYFPNCATFYYSNIWKNNTLGTSEVMSQHIKISKSPKTDDLSKKKDWLNFRGKHGAIGQVTIGSKQNLVCVPSDLIITVPGQTNKIPPNTTCLVKQAQHHNLPLGIVINRCVATTKAWSVPVILVNTTKQNECIQQPLLAAELFNMDQIEEAEHKASMERQGDNINISFLPVAPNYFRVK